MTENSPFIPGARVAITDGYDHWSEGFVEKVHKTGRFTLKGGNGQQWKPNSHSDYWAAYKTGGRIWDREKLRIWDAAADAEINGIMAQQARKRRWQELRVRIERVREYHLTDKMLDQIEAALSSPEQTK